MSYFLKNLRIKSKLFLDPKGTQLDGQNGASPGSEPDWSHLPVVVAIITVIALLIGSVYMCTRKESTAQEEMNLYGGDHQHAEKQSLKSRSGQNGKAPARDASRPRRASLEEADDALNKALQQHRVEEAHIGNIMSVASDDSELALN